MSGRRQNADIADTLHLRDVAMATPFCLLMGYNFGCMIASDTLMCMWFDSRVGFRVKLSDEDIVDFEVLRDVAMATISGFLYMGCTCFCIVCYFVSSIVLPIVLFGLTTTKLNKLYYYYHIGAT